jgi:hypothetical protein
VFASPSLIPGLSHKTASSSLLFTQKQRKWWALPSSLSGNLTEERDHWTSSTTQRVQGNSVNESVGSSTWMYWGKKFKSAFWFVLLEGFKQVLGTFKRGHFQHYSSINIAQTAAPYPHSNHPNTVTESNNTDIMMAPASKKKIGQSQMCLRSLTMQLNITWH